MEVERVEAVLRTAAAEVMAATLAAGVEADWHERTGLTEGVARLAREVRERRAPDEVIRAGAYSVERWVLAPPGGDGDAVYMHAIRGTDPDPWHDHPADNVSWILEGRMVESRRTEGGEGVPRMLGSGECAARRAESAHRLAVHSRMVVTLWIRGPTRRAWGFHTEDGWVESGAWSGVADRSVDRTVRAPRGQP